MGGGLDRSACVCQYLDVSVPASSPLRRDKVVLSKP